MVGEPCAAQEPLFLARNPQERHAVRLRTLAECLGNLQQRARARRVVVRAVVDLALVVHSNVIIVGTEDDHLFLLFRVGAGEEAEHVTVALELFPCGSDGNPVRMLPLLSRAACYRGGGQAAHENIADRVGQDERGQALGARGPGSCWGERIRGSHR